MWLRMPCKPSGEHAANLMSNDLLIQQQSEDSGGQGRFGEAKRGNSNSESESWPKNGEKERLITCCDGEEEKPREVDMDCTASSKDMYVSSRKCMEEEEDKQLKTGVESLVTQAMPDDEGEKGHLRDKACGLDEVDISAQFVDVDVGMGKKDFRSTVKV